MEGMDVDLSSFGLQPTDFDLNSLLSDRDLLKDLHSLGWRETHDNTTTHPDSNITNNEAQSKKKPTMEVSDLPLLDISHLVRDPEGAEETLTVTAEDLRDEDLLREYAALSAGESLSTQAQHTTSAHNTQPPLTKGVPLTPPHNTPTQPSQPTHTQSQAVDFSSVRTAEEAKRRAVQSRREGDTDTALQWFRLAKRLEQEQTVQRSVTQIQTLAQIQTTNAASAAVADNNKRQKTAPLSTATSIPSPADAHRQQWIALEQAITEASQQALTRAKAAKAASQNSAAVQHMREYKTWEQELTVLRSRAALPHCVAPLFHWESEKHSEEITNADLAENQLRVTIDKITGIDNLVTPYSSRSLSVRIVFNANGKDDAENVCVTSPQSKYDTQTHSAEFAYTVSLSVINVKRGKVAATSLARRRNTLSVEVVLHRGFLWSDVCLARAQLSLTALSDQCTHTQGVSLVACEEKERSTATGRVELTLSLRTPLLQPALRVWTERRLVMQPWSEITPTQAPPQQTHTQSVETPTNTDVHTVTQTTTQAPTQTTSTDTASSSGVSEVSDAELRDPEAVTWLESNDVLVAEITRTEETLAQTRTDSALSEEDRDLGVIQLESRLQLLHVKLQVLEQRVMSEELSLAQYLDILRERVRKDTKLALALKAQGKASLAVRVYGRVKMMKEEIATADSNEEEGEGEGEEQSQ